MADVTLSGKAHATGLEDGAFDFVIMNPPFNAGHDRATPDALKRGAHVMPHGLFSWTRSAAAIVKPRGGIAIIARPQSIGENLAAFSGRFGSADPADPSASGRRGDPHRRARRTRFSRQTFSLMPPLFLHEQGSDRFSMRADDISNGRASLFGD